MKTKEYKAPAEHKDRFRKKVNLNDILMIHDDGEIRIVKITHRSSGDKDNFIGG